MNKWLITGVSGGLGEALANLALTRGDIVAGTVRRQADLSRFEAFAPGQAHGFLCDLGDEVAVREMIEAAEASVGGLDILVNNAGYGLVGAIEEATMFEIRRQFDVNVFGPIAAIQGVLPYFRTRGRGHIINISSISGVAPWAGTGIYCGTKFAMEGIGQTLALEVGALGIKVTNIEPGGMRTGYAGRSMAIAACKIGDYEETARNAERILTLYAGREPSDPAKVAAAIFGIAGVDDPPLQLFLGEDAVLFATRKLGQSLAELGKWAPVSLSTNYNE